MTAVGDEQPPAVSRLATGEESTLRFRDGNHKGEVRSTEEDVGGSSQPRSNPQFKAEFRASVSQTAASDGDADETLRRVESARDGRAMIGATYVTMSSSSVDDLCHRD